MAGFYDPLSAVLRGRSLPPAPQLAPPRLGPQGQMTGGYDGRGGAMDYPISAGETIAAGLGEFAQALGRRKKLDKQQARTDVRDWMELRAQGLPVNEQKLAQRFKKAYGDIVDFESTVPFSPTPQPQQQMQNPYGLPPASTGQIEQSFLTQQQPQQMRNVSLPMPQMGGVDPRMQSFLTANAPQQQPMTLPGQPPPMMPPGMPPQGPPRPPMNMQVPSPQLQQSEGIASSMLLPPRSNVAFQTAPVGNLNVRRNPLQRMTDAMGISQAPLNPMSPAAHYLRDFGKRADSERALGSQLNSEKMRSELEDFQQQRIGRSMLEMFISGKDPNGNSLTREDRNKFEIMLRQARFGKAAKPLLDQVSEHDMTSVEFDLRARGVPEEEIDEGMRKFNFGRLGDKYWTRYSDLAKSLGDQYEGAELGAAVKSVLSGAGLPDPQRMPLKKQLEVSDKMDKIIAEYPELDLPLHRRTRGLVLGDMLSGDIPMAYKRLEDYHSKGYFERLDKDKSSAQRDAEIGISRGNLRANQARVGLEQQRVGLEQERIEMDRNRDQREDSKFQLDAVIRTVPQIRDSYEQWKVGKLSMTQLTEAYNLLAGPIKGATVTLGRQRSFAPDAPPSFNAPAGLPSEQQPVEVAPAATKEFMDSAMNYAGAVFSGRAVGYSKAVTVGQIRNFAAMRGISTEDAVALLDDHGYKLPPELSGPFRSEEQPRSFDVASPVRLRR